MRVDVDTPSKKMMEGRKVKKNVSKFHHLYSFKNELKCLRFLLTNYVNIVWRFFFHFFSLFSSLPSIDSETHVKKAASEVNATTAVKKLDGRRKTTIDNSTMDETHPWKSQKWEARQMNFSWASTAPLWVVRDIWDFFCMQTILALARFPGFFISPLQSLLPSSIFFLFSRQLKIEWNKGRQPKIDENSFLYSHCVSTNRSSGTAWKNR